jgi:hypothetical protein
MRVIPTAAGEGGHDPLKRGEIGIGKPLWIAGGRQRRRYGRLFGTTTVKNERGNVRAFSDGWYMASPGTA